MLGNMILDGGCHCGAVRVSLTLTTAPEETQVRACACSFCRAHGARTVADPKGAVRITPRAPDAIVRYRFGLLTADYLICRHCGVYVAAVCESDTGLRAAVNVNALDARIRFDPVPPASSFAGETADGRRARRAASWTPATLVV